jgi:hypothetical protein
MFLTEPFGGFTSAANARVAGDFRGIGRPKIL